MIKHRRLLIVSSLVAGIFFLLGLLGSTQLPKLRALILVQIERFSRDHSPVRVLPKSIDISFVPIGITLNDVRIVPKDEVAAYIDPMMIRSASIELSPWQLIQGRLRVTEISLLGVSAAARVPKGDKKDSAPLDGLFELLAQVPINKIKLEESEIAVSVASPRLELEISDIHLEIQKTRGSLQIGLGSATVRARENEKKPAVRIDAEGEALIARDRIEIEAVRIRRGESFVSLSGSLQGITEKLIFPDLELALRSEFRLEGVPTLAFTSLIGSRTLPAMKGKVTLDAKIGRTQGQAPTIDFNGSTDGVRLLNKYLLDRVETAGSFKKGTAHMAKILVENPAGTLIFNDTTIETGEHFSLKTKAQVSRMQIHELFKSLGLPAIPVWMQLSGDLPCSATSTPTLSLTCKGTARGENLLIRDDIKSASTIVALREFNANGEFTVDKDKVSYHTELSMPNSKGRSRGVIGYETGFKIDYEADNFAFKDITNLSDLRIEGSTRIKGSTEGDSHAATLRLEANGSDLWFEDFWLGSTRALLQYKAGELSFSGIEGHYSVSRYNGEVKLNIPKSEVNMVGRVPFFDAKDLFTVFSRKVQLPFPVTGTGQAQIQVSGPLEFTKLSYDIKSSLFKGSVYGEPFDQANFDIHAKSGEVRTDRVQITKGPAVITLSGSGHPDGNIKTVLRGRGLRLEDSTLVNSTGLSLSGLLEFDMDMAGPVLAPDTDWRGSLTKTAIAEQVVPDSEIHLKFTSKTIEGGGVFLGEVVKADFVLPFDNQAPFAIKLSTQDWNFAPLFAAISGPGSRKDYEGRLTTQINLSSPAGGFWNASGTIEVPKFSLARGQLELASQKPLLVQMKNGQVEVKQFELIGDNTFLKVENSKNPTTKVDAQFNGKLDLSLFALLTPFFEDLRGVISFAFNLKSGPGTTDLLGSAYIDKAYLKFFDFPHPFEAIRADLLFNQRKILFNTIKAEFGGGKVDATGSMELKGYKNYPVNVSGTFDRVTLQVPDKIKTSGSGHMSFTGSWFPFLLKGEYNVKEGLFAKEFGGESGIGSSGIRRDYFLPELLLQDNFVPILVDLQINFNRGIDVKNELVEGKALGALSVKGNPTKPSVLGTITTDNETKIYFKDSTFEVTSSNIQFTDPNELNPRLYLAARSRVQDHDINLLVQGTGSKPDILLTSVPPLPEKDIISLLALGATDTQLSDKVAGSEQASSTGLQISSGVLKNNPISNVIQEKLGFNVQFSPGFDDTTNSAVQKIIVSRQFSPKLGVTASQSFSGKKKTSEAQVRYRLNDRVSLIGSWQGRDYEETSDATAPSIENPNLFGLDVEYKFEFK